MLESAEWQRKGMSKGKEKRSKSMREMWVRGSRELSPHENNHTLGHTHTTGPKLQRVCMFINQFKLCDSARVGDGVEDGRKWQRLKTIRVKRQGNLSLPAQLPQFLAWNTLLDSNLFTWWDTTCQRYICTKVSYYCTTMSACITAGKSRASKRAIARVCWKVSGKWALCPQQPIHELAAILARARTHVCEAMQLSCVWFFQPLCLRIYSVRSVVVKGRNWHGCSSCKRRRIRPANVFFVKCTTDKCASAALGSARRGGEERLALSCVCMLCVCIRVHIYTYVNVKGRH